MQENITLARPYAEAAFDTAKEESSYDAWDSMLETLSLVAKDENMQTLVNNPSIDKSVLHELVLELCGDKLTDKSCKNFVQIVIDAGRLLQAPAMYQLFQQQRSSQEGGVSVDVISAFPLEKSQQDEIIGAMEKRLGKKVSVNASVDESLIGGVVIRTGDSVIDASVKGRLTSLTNQFAE